MKDRLKIGIKYCGGCKPQYDRGETVRQIVAAHPECEWENVNEDTDYDLLVVVGGCACCCAGYSQYRYAALRKVWEPAHFERLSEELAAGGRVG